jgi:pimeloyl-ACP methyl ester carboxylesterase
MIDDDAANRHWFTLSMPTWGRYLSGPIVLVGHSYGGNVISTAALDNDQVQALVYFNGWMCDVGESQPLLLEKFEGSLVGLRSGPSRLPTRTAAGAPTFTSPPRHSERPSQPMSILRRPP